VDTLEILVTGMTCDHCARAVRDEVGALPGVSAVDVDVAAGKVVITGSPLPGQAALSAAITEAGYELDG
jgi:copper chaperone CopZ